MKHVDGVLKRKGFSLLAMLAIAFFLVDLSSLLESSSLEEASL
jgi:hypothetical protein